MVLQTWQMHFYDVILCVLYDLEQNQTMQNSQKNHKLSYFDSFIPVGSKSMMFKKGRWWKIMKLPLKGEEE